jgi:OmpA-OmpF porin, OOP family
VKKVLPHIGDSPKKRKNLFPSLTTFAIPTLALDSWYLITVQIVAVPLLQILDDGACVKMFISALVNAWKHQKFFECVHNRTYQRKLVNKRNVFYVSAFISMLSMLIACSTNVKKADIASTANPQEEISKLDNDLITATTKNIDVLAPSEFEDSEKWLVEAKKDQANQEKQEEILDDIRTSRGFLEKAYVISANRAEKAPGLFEARQAALNAGASKYSELSSDLRGVDKDVSSEAATLANLDSETISTLQERYVALERRATILTRLGTSQAIFNGLKKDGASKQAPVTYKKAELSLKNGESVISSNVRNPQGYKAAVETAVTDTALLNDVINVIKQNGKNLAESSALKMVSQNRQIKALNTDLSASNAESKTLTKELKDTEQDLNTANEHVETQRAMENARTQFSSDEAEAYQQGKDLLIRLKQVNFASGRADLPGAAIELLAKVSAIAKSMNATELKVEGHTDSVGSESQNKIISEKRASAVASYFKSNGFSEVTSQGFGFQKPIATNKSKEGRAQNRRVDIIITPENLSVVQ